MIMMIDDHVDEHDENHDENHDDTCPAWAAMRIHRGPAACPGERVQPGVRVRKAEGHGARPRPAGAQGLPGPRRATQRPSLDTV